MITLRRSASRGVADHGWLVSRHTFSFADYHDPNFMGFGSLRVINEDRVQPGQGFGTHGHRDMEIVSYVLSGALEHKDSLGTGSIIRPGEVQRMSAGTGIRHSEFNPSADAIVHFYQIWILPERPGGEPGYEQKTFPDEEKRGVLRLVGARDGRDGAVRIGQDVDLYASILDPGQGVSHALGEGRKAWVQLARGNIVVNGLELEAGDGAAISRTAEIAVEAGGAVGASQSAELLLFDMG